MASKLFRIVSGASLLVTALGVATTPPAAAYTSPTTVNLGTAGAYGVLAGSAVSNTGPSVIDGDLGVSPGSSVSGFPPGTVTPPGTIHVADGPAGTAQSDLTTAYNFAAGQPFDANLTGVDLGTQTLTTGVYAFSTSAQLTGTLVLDGEGNPNNVFIFQIGTTLTTASASNVLLTNGASACQIFWQVGSSATLGTNSTLAGTVLALQSITATTGVNVYGSLLASNGAVTLDSNNVQPTCASSSALPQVNVVVSAAASPSSLPEPGGTFNYTVAVTNNGATVVTLTSLNDNVYGDLNGQGNCATGGTIAAGATYNCAFTGDFFGSGGDSQTNTVTAAVVDAAGVTAIGTDSATVSIRRNGVLEICKLANNSNGPVTGTYTFNVAGRSVDVPVGSCSGPLTVPSGQLTVTEVVKSGVRISACSTRPAVRLVSCDPALSRAVVRIVAGDVTNETILYITNRIINSTLTGAIKVCKIAGSGVAVGTNFNFAVGSKSVTVPAGPASQGGYCKFVYGFAQGTNVTVTEGARAGTHVSAITVEPLARKVSSNTTNRTATVKVGSGTTVVSFTNVAL